MKHDVRQHCANRACKTAIFTHLWAVDNKVYCSPWCERNKGKNPNKIIIKPLAS